MTAFAPISGASDSWMCDNKMSLLPYVTVVGKYREFHKLYGNRQFTDAGALLLSLLTARVAPKR